MIGFSVGDKVMLAMHPDIGLWTGKPPGSVGTVAGPLERAPGIEEPCWSNSHRVDFDDGTHDWYVPQCLRKLEPPPPPQVREEVGSWADCPWWPQEVIA